MSGSVEQVWQQMLQRARGGLVALNDTQAPTAPADLAGFTTAEAVSALKRRYAPLVDGPVDQPCVIAQLGQSLDGRIATPNGHAQFVTGEADRAHLHRLRALCDAVLVGPGTVIADNPQLTVRAVAGPNPVRIVSLARDGFKPHWGLLQDGAAPAWVVAPAAVSAPPADRQLVAASSEPADILAAIRQAGIQRLLVEGGARTVSAWIAAGLVDYLYLTIAPVIIGSGPSGLQLPAIEHMDEALRPAVEQFPMGPDRLYRLAMNSALYCAS